MTICFACYRFTSFFKSDQAVNRITNALGFGFTFSLCQKTIPVLFLALLQSF